MLQLGGTRDNNGVVSGGYSLLTDNPDHDIEDYIRKYIPLESFKPWLRRSWPGGGLAMLTYPAAYYPEPPLKINRFYWPTGATRWSYGHFLCDSDTATQLSLQAFPANQPYAKLPFIIGNPEQVNNQPSGESISTNVYMLPPTPLSGIRGLTGNTTSLYLITLVDQRYFWWWKNFGTLTVTSTTQWTDLLNGLAMNLGLTPASSSSPNGGNFVIQSVDPAYLQPSIQMWSLPYEPAPIIMDALAFNVGQRVVADFQGNILTMGYTMSLTLLNADMASQKGQQRVVLSGGQRFASPL